MAEPRTPPATLRISSVTVRGRSLTARQGEAVAISVAQSLAARFATTGASLEQLTLRVPAAAIGGVDPAAGADTQGDGHG